MQNQEVINRRGIFGFAEVNTGGRKVECPNCHVPFDPHLGNLMTEKFECKSCNASLSYRNKAKKAVKCPGCNFTRPIPNNLTILVCDRCEALIIYQKGDTNVKCCYCKHLTNPLEVDLGVGSQVNRFFPRRPHLQVNRVDPPPPPPEVNRIVLPPQVNRIVPPPQVNRVDPLPQVNRVDLPPQINRVEPPPQVNRVVPPPQDNRFVSLRVKRRKRRANAETESTASSSFIPKPEIPTHNIVADYLEAAAEIVKNVALMMRTIKRETEEDKTKAKGKKICTD